jgi:hypothetical protein
MKSRGFEDDRIGYLLKRVQFRLRSQMDKVLESKGLTTPQYAVLSFLEHEPGASSAELARRSFVTPQTMIRIVENLETDPNRYPSADEAADLGVDLRQLLYGRRRNVSRVLFTIEGQTVNILRVRHAAQDLPDSDNIS